MSSITMSENKENLDIVVRMYSDDLAIDLWRLYQPDTSYYADHRFHGPEQYYEDYVNDNITVLVNNKRIKANLNDVEKLELETVIKLSIESKKEIKKLHVENRILMGLYPDQVNLFIYKDSISEKAFRFTTSDYKGELVAK